MTWEEEWPGTPYQRRGSEEKGQTGPFTVELKPSACEGVERIATFRSDHGEVVSFPSRGAAERTLVDESDGRGLRLQSAAPNDPDDVDAYLVKVRTPEPDPGERGPPADGWTFSLRAQQVGVLAESLFAAYSWNPPPIVAYASRDLALDPDEFRVEVDRTPSSVGRFDRDEEGGTWVPDFGFYVRRCTSRRAHGSSGSVIKRYVAEVKHGSTCFERNQRRRMEKLAAETDDSLDVLIVRVDLEGIPQSYGLSIRSIRELDE